jgi:acyl-ACP thioesterase
MAIAPDFTSVFSKEWEINIMQCAPNGQLRHTELCHLLQLTSAAHSDKGGISFSDMQEFDQAWVLSKMRLEIDRMPMYNDTIVIKTWIVSLVSSRSVRALEVFLDGKKIIGCEAAWAVFNTVKRRPEMLALPDEHFEKFTTTFATSSRVKKIALPDENQPSVKSRDVMYSDLDIVNHVNNIKYLEWCLDVTAAKRLLNTHISALDMNFMKELMLGDSIEITAQDLKHESVYAILKDSKPCFALQVTWSK